MLKIIGHQTDILYDVTTVFARCRTVVRDFDESRKGA